MYFRVFRGGGLQSMETSEKKPKIDVIDRKILRALQREGRLSFRDLGSRIHMTLNVALDLRAAKTGAYFLATIRGADNGTYYYPLKVN